MRGQGHLNINGARLAYDEAGSGDPIVFLHAGVTDRSMWDPQFAAFATRYRCIRYDLRGFGASTLPPEAFNSRADVAAVLETLGVERPVLVGCSAGGSLALDFALERPERVRALVLVGTGVSGNVPPQELRDAINGIDALADKGDLDGAAETSARIWLDGARPAGSVRGPLRERYLRMNRHQARREQEWMRIHKDFPSPIRLEPPALGRLESVRARALVVVGLADQPFVVETCREVARRVPGADLIEIPDAAHLANLERPEPFNGALATFLATLSEDGAVVRSP